MQPDTAFFLSPPVRQPLYVNNVLILPYCKPPERAFLLLIEFYAGRLLLRLLRLIPINGGTALRVSPCLWAFCS